MLLRLIKISVFKKELLKTSYQQEFWIPIICQIIPENLVN